MHVFFALQASIEFQNASVIGLVVYYYTTIIMAQSIDKLSTKELVEMLKKKYKIDSPWLQTIEGIVVTALLQL